MITPRDMPFELAVKIIDEISKKNTTINISLNENGEGLLCQYFIDVFWYLRDKVPDANAILHTNIERMNQNMAREVLRLSPNENARISNGNVIEESIEDIWNGDRRHHIMNKLLLRQFDQLGTPCLYCDQSPLPDL